MFNIKYRPRSFSQVSGQVFAKKILQKIVENPNKVPSHSLILSGSWGIGKTTLCQVFAREINHLSIDEELDPSFYIEYDSSVVGNVDSIREIRDYLSYYIQVNSNKYTVVVFDEVQEASQKSQQQLLKFLEELSGNLFVIFATTNPEKIIDTIHSRSLEIRLDPLSKEEIHNLLVRIIEQEKLTVPDSILDLISDYSTGHGRDAVKLLELYYLMEDEESFISFSKRCYVVIEKIFNSVFQNSFEDSYIKELFNFPMAFVLHDLEKYFNHLVFNYKSFNLSLKEITFIFSFYVRYKKNIKSDSDLFSFIYLIVENLINIKGGTANEVGGRVQSTNNSIFAKKG